MKNVKEEKCKRRYAKEKNEKMKKPKMEKKN